LLKVALSTKIKSNQIKIEIEQILATKLFIKLIG